MGQVLNQNYHCLRLPLVDSKVRFEVLPLVGGCAALTHQRRFLSQRRATNVSGLDPRAPCPLYPRKRTFAAAGRMSALCQLRPFKSSAFTKRNIRLTHPEPPHLSVAGHSNGDLSLTTLLAIGFGAYPVAPHHKSWMLRNFFLGSDLTTAKPKKLQTKNACTRLPARARANEEPMPCGSRYLL